MKLRLQLMVSFLIVCALALAANSYSHPQRTGTDPRSFIGVGVTFVALVDSVEAKSAAARAGIAAGDILVKDGKTRFERADMLNARLKNLTVYRPGDGSVRVMDLRSGKGIKATVGLMVNDVFPGSPAEIAGVERYDVLVSLNDKPITRASIDERKQGLASFALATRAGRRDVIAETVAVADMDGLIARAKNVGTGAAPCNPQVDCCDPLYWWRCSWLSNACQQSNVLEGCGYTAGQGPIYDCCVVWVV